MMTNDEYDDLRIELAKLRKQMVPSSYGLIPASVEHLEKLLATSDDRMEIYTLLVGECSRSRNDRLYIDCLRRRVNDFPGEPISYTGLAYALAIIGPEHRDEALITAKRALELAKSQDRQIRYSATTLARVALMNDDYDALTKSLEELVADTGTQREEDTGYEFDFVQQIDVRRIDANLLQRYRQLEK